MKISISFKSILAMLPIFFYLGNLYRMFGNSSFIYQMLLLLTGIIGIAILFLTKTYINNIYLLIFVIYSLTLIFNWMIIENVSFYDCIQSILIFGIAVVMVKFQVTYRQGQFLFFVTCFAFVVNMFLGADVRTLLTSSSNYISILLLIGVSFYYITIGQLRNTLQIIDILPAAICFALSVWARGRGGILSCGIFLICILAVYIKDLTNKNTKRVLLLVLLFIAVLITLSYFDVNILDQMMNLGKWKTRGTDNSARLAIWQSYFLKVKESFTYILFGAPLDEIGIIRLYDGNCHNSFIQLHAYNGIIMTVLILGFLFKAILYYVKQKNYVYISIFLAICVRGLTDKFIFGQYGMPIMLYFILYPIQQYNYKIKNVIYNKKEYKNKYYCGVKR